MGSFRHWGRQWNGNRSEMRERAHHAEPAIQFPIWDGFYGIPQMGLEHGSGSQTRVLNTTQHRTEAGAAGLTFPTPPQPPSTQSFVLLLLLLVV